MINIFLGAVIFRFINSRVAGQPWPPKFKGEPDCSHLPPYREDTPPVARNRPSTGPWAVLGIRPTSDVQAIKKAYRMKIKQCHPDVAGPGSTKRAAELNEAYKEALKYT